MEIKLLNYKNFNKTLAKYHSRKTLDNKYMKAVLFVEQQPANYSGLNFTASFESACNQYADYKVREAHNEYSQPSSYMTLKCFIFPISNQSEMEGELHKLGLRLRFNKLPSIMVFSLQNQYIEQYHHFNLDNMLSIAEMDRKIVSKMYYFIYDELSIKKVYMDFHLVHDCDEFDELIENYRKQFFVMRGSKVPAKQWSSQMDLVVNLSKTDHKLFQNMPLFFSECFPDPEYFNQSLNHLVFYERGVRSKKLEFNEQIINNTNVIYQFINLQAQPDYYLFDQSQIFQFLNNKSSVLVYFSTETKESTAKMAEIQKVYDTLKIQFKIFIADISEIERTKKRQKTEHLRQLNQWLNWVDIQNTSESSLVIFQSQSDHNIHRYKLTEIDEKSLINFYYRYLVGSLDPVLRSVDRQQYIVENRDDPNYGIVYLNGEDMNKRILERHSNLLIVVCPLDQPPCKGQTQNLIKTVHQTIKKYRNYNNYRQDYDDMEIVFFDSLKNDILYGEPVSAYPTIRILTNLTRLGHLPCGFQELKIQYGQQLDTEEVVEFLRIGVESNYNFTNNLRFEGQEGLEQVRQKTSDKKAQQMMEQIKKQQAIKIDAQQGRILDNQEIKLKDHKKVLESDDIKQEL